VHVCVRVFVLPQAHVSGGVRAADWMRAFRLRVLVCVREGVYIYIVDLRDVCACLRQSRPQFRPRFTMPCPPPITPVCVGECGCGSVGVGVGLCACVLVHVCVYVCVRVCVDVYVYIYIYTYIYICLCVCV